MFAVSPVLRLKTFLEQLCDNITRFQIHQLKIAANPPAAVKKEKNPLIRSIV